MQRAEWDRPEPRHEGVGAGEGPARVFVVDDNDLTRRTLKSIVSHDAGLEVVGEAVNGASALEGINITQPHLVCLDLVMPRLDGLAVLRTLRSGKYPPTAVVIITGETTIEVLTQARELGVDGIVHKPFNAATVLDTIYSALARQRRSNSAAMASHITR